MPFVTRKSLLTVSMLCGVALLAVGAFVWSGIYNIAADDQHTRPVHALMQTLRERSIAARAGKLKVPDLADPARIAQGAGNYDAMCMGCHLAPGMDATEMSTGLYPAPPNLAHEIVKPAEAFWVIKHGIKASGMPAWGKSIGDEYIWNMAAFLQQLPTLNAAQYEAMVASSEGHSHGGGETMADDDGDAPDKTADRHAGMRIRNAGTVDESEPHAHPPGTPVDHHRPAVTEAREPLRQPTQADDGHDHKH